MGTKSRKKGICLPQRRQRARTREKGGRKMRKPGGRVSIPKEMLILTE